MPVTLIDKGLGELIKQAKAWGDYVLTLGFLGQSGQFENSFDQSWYDGARGGRNTHGSDS